MVLSIGTDTKKKGKNMKIYSIHDGTRKDTGACIDAGLDRKEVIQSATNYYEEKMSDDGEYGSHEVDALLYIYDEDANTEEFEHITLDLIVEKPIDAQREWGTWNRVSSGVR